jgi:hypothetical protein
MQELRTRAQQEVSTLRGLSFQSNVGMAELSGWEYGTRTREMAETIGGEELRTLSRLAAAGGVLPEGTDLASLAAGFASVSAGATYSPLDKQVLLVGKSRSDSLIKHEFVHALQDQHFDLMRLLLVRPYNFDRTEAVFALVEGDAMNVQRRAEEGEAYGRKSLEEVTRQESARFAAYRQEIGRLFPPLITETFIFRYRDGARFVEALRRKNGEQAVDALFRRPPVSSEQILHPEKYLDGELPREIQLDQEGFAARGWQLTASTPLGEIGLRGLLMAGVVDQSAIRAAAGWNGDRAYLFEKSGGTPLFVWKSLWDRPTDALEFFEAYNALQRARKATQVNDSLNSNDAAQNIWTDGQRLTLIRREGEQVIIIRGAEGDLQSALELASR